MTPFWRKALMSLVLVVSNFLTGVIIVLVFKKASAYANTVQSGSNMTTGGLFFGIVAIILIPELIVMAKQFTKTYDIGLPVFLIVGFLITFGFLSMVIVDMVSKFLKPKRSEHSHTHETSPAEIPMEDRLVNAEPAENEQPKKRGGLVKYCIFACLISVHSLVEGIPLGIKNLNSEIDAFFYPLLVHKVLEAMSVACAGVRQKKWHALFGSFIHACMTPLGIAVGHYFGNMEPSFWSDLTVLCLMGFSTGTILHIAVVEILIPEFKNRVLRPSVNVVLFLSGFTLTAITAFLVHYIEGN
ncbi:unnamed protein product [Caenorhabditis sp. 36 PRJEB53466]|nr:unnamed protein product [Caenorhabditis sp. 36 PRJEB53466]